MSKAADRLRKARIEAGFETATSAAEAMGIKYPTYAAHEGGHRDFEKSADAYARKFRVSLEWLLTGRSPQPSPINIRGLQPGAIGASILVTGAIQAGRWLDKDEEAMHEIDLAVPSFPGYPHEIQRAYIVIGESLNRVAKHGSILVAVDVAAGGIDIKDNDLVIVERSRYAGQQVEVTAKRIRKTLHGFELWPESDDPRWQRPVALNDASSEHEEMRVAAKVIWVVNKP